ncbi:unnamed protein product [Lepeophtheirus salmonis]|uniref:(salmon louse) hypothetical protein n=1 Tax=Lepeophtheirus salmonis TaxID=72036 RepID=A0A7R8CPV0_LEPSM|nr:unnamed protein product [Lepeophtheirus salmonis]CAF2851967.1 unnamed protein product [Lepeophtheirus salmonis]
MELYVHYLVIFTSIFILFTVPSECLYDQKLLLRSLSKQFRDIYEDLNDHHINVPNERKEKIDDDNNKYIILVQEKEDHDDTDYEEEIIEYEYPYYEDSDDGNKYMKILIPYPTYGPRLLQYQKSYKRQRYRMKPFAEPYRPTNDQKMKYNRHKQFRNHPSNTRFSNDITRHLTNPDFYDDRGTYNSNLKCKTTVKSVGDYGNMDKSPKEYTELTPAKSIYTSTQDILQETYFHEKQNYYHPYVISPSTYRQVESLGNEYIPDKDIPSPTLPSKNRKSLDRSSNEYALRRERNNLAVRRSRERSKFDSKNCVVENWI